MDHQKNSPDFYPMPFQRIFTMLFYELCNPEAVLESINWHTLMAFSNAYHYLCPMKAPGFVFSWLELIGYRTFVMRMMQHSPDKKGWPIYAQLLSDLFKFNDAARGAVGIHDGLPGEDKRLEPRGAHGLLEVAAAVVRARRRQAQPVLLQGPRRAAQLPGLHQHGGVPRRGPLPAHRALVPQPLEPHPQGKLADRPPGRVGGQQVRVAGPDEGGDQAPSPRRRQQPLARGAHGPRALGAPPRGGRQLLRRGGGRPGQGRATGPAAPADRGRGGPERERVLHGPPPRAEGAGGGRGPRPRRGRGGGGPGGGGARGGGGRQGEEAFYAMLSEDLF